MFGPVKCQISSKNDIGQKSENTVDHFGISAMRTNSASIFDQFLADDVIVVISDNICVAVFNVNYYTPVYMIKCKGN